MVLVVNGYVEVRTISQVRECLARMVALEALGRR